MTNILYIDDNAHAGLLAKIYLEREGYHVFVAKDTTRARSFLSKHPIACIITDVGMPGESGIEFYHWLQSQNEYKNLPLIFVSAHAFQINEIKNQSTITFLEKPIFFPDLIHRLKKLLNPQ